MVRHEAPWAPAPAQLREPLVPVEPSRPNHEAPWAAAADPGSSRERARSHVPRQAGLYTTRPNTTYVAAHVPRQGCATSATWLCCESMRGLTAGAGVALACPSPTTTAAATATKEAHTVLLRTHSQRQVLPPHSGVCQLGVGKVCHVRLGHGPLGNIRLDPHPHGRLTITTRPAGQDESRNRATPPAGAHETRVPGCGTRARAQRAGSRSERPHPRGLPGTQTPLRGWRSTRGRREQHRCAWPHQLDTSNGHAQRECACPSRGGRCYEASGCGKATRRGSGAREGEYPSAPATLATA